MFYLEDTIEFLERNPELVKINQHILMNEGYQKSLAEDKEFLNTVYPWEELAEDSFDHREIAYEKLVRILKYFKTHLGKII